MNVSEDLIRQVIMKVLSEQGTGVSNNYAEGFEKVKDPSGIIKIGTHTVPLERFEQDGVNLKDVTTLQESPNMGCGIMELKGTSFEWTLTYDEYDICLEGVLEIEIDGRVLTAKPGEIIFIPKNSHIHFQTPSYAKYVYITYPADWA